MGNITLSISSLPLQLALVANPGFHAQARAKTRNTPPPPPPPLSHSARQLKAKRAISTPPPDNVPHNMHRIPRRGAPDSDSFAGNFCGAARFFLQHVHIHDASASLLATFLPPLPFLPLPLPPSTK